MFSWLWSAGFAMVAAAPRIACLDLDTFFVSVERVLDASLVGKAVDMRDGTAGGEALVMFGDALLELSAGHTPPERLRPWAAAFDRAIARCTKEESPEVLYNDWIADEIWMFRWDEWGASDTGRKEMATRLAVARKVQERLQALGLRPDQAAAEAIMVVETATVSSEWPKAAEAISED